MSDIYRMSGVLLLLAVLSGCASSPVQERTLDNGLKVVVREDHRAPVVVSQIWYRVGGIDEPEGLTGISHVLEHLMFKGTKSLKPGEFSRLIAADNIAGGDLIDGDIAVNATTDFHGAEALLRRSLYSQCETRLDFVVGYRFARLNDDLQISHTSTTLTNNIFPAPNPIGTVFDVTDYANLTFEAPDRETFPALDLGFEAARRGGTAGAALNAADEAAVRRFLDGDLSFPDIAALCTTALAAHPFTPHPTLDDLERVDQWARCEAKTLC